MVSVTAPSRASYGWKGLPARLAGLAGWRRALAAGVLGLVAVLALPPFYVFPLLVVAFTGLLWLAEGVSTRRSAFALGWWFGFGHFVGGLYWITNALLVDAAQFGWLAPFAVSGLSVYFAVFPGLAVLAWHELRRRGVTATWRSPLAFGLLWVLGEWLRGLLLTGFPWNLMATVWSFSPETLQTAALVGAYGLSLFTVTAAAAPALLVEDVGRRCRAWICVAALTGPLVLGVIYGVWRLAGASSADVVGVQLRLVQANIDQRLKWQNDERLRIVRKYFDLSASPAALDALPVTHVIWPETAVPYFLADEPALLNAAGEFVAKALPPGGLLITGAPRKSRRDGASSSAESFEVWNSLFAIDADGQVVATYDKHHLVPFGEYVPLRDWLPIDKITPGGIDFSAGPGPRTMQLPGLLPPASPLICYEAIFPGQVTASSDGETPRPEWLLNVTNDAWFGYSTGPYQHLASARLRAVEEGLPMVRAANTGVSAVFDPYGRLRGSLALGHEGVLDSALPAALPPTPYSRFGNLIFFVIALVAGVAVVIRRPSSSSN